MIRLWLSRGMTVPIQEQLSAQLTLGILSGRIAPGEKLPSVRALGRQLHLHPNTISAIYQLLAERGWVSKRQGSGVFVRELNPPDAVGNVDSFMRCCFAEGLKLGYSVEEMHRAVAGLMGEARTPAFIVVDPDAQFARILAHELSQALEREIGFAGVEEICQTTNPQACILLAEASAARVLSVFEPAQHKTIRLKSMQDYLADRKRPDVPVLVAVASRSKSVRAWASTLLCALGFPADVVLLRDPAQPDWRNGLALCDVVATDVLTAAELDENVKPIVFRMVADDFTAEMRSLLPP